MGLWAVPVASATFWTSLTLLDPLAVIHLSPARMRACSRLQSS